MAIYATTATKKGSLAQKGQQELARQGANNTPRQGMTAQGARQVGAQTPAPGAAATRALGANPLAVTSTATAPYRAQQGVQQKGPGAAQAFATNAVPQGTARSFAANAVPAAQTRQMQALRNGAPNLAAAQPGGGMPTRPGASGPRYAEGQGPGAEVGDRAFAWATPSYGASDYTAIPPGGGGGGNTAPWWQGGGKWVPGGDGKSGGGATGAIPSDRDGAMAEELGARGYHGAGNVAAGRGDTGVVAPAGVTGPSLGYAGGGSTAARVNPDGNTPTRYGTIPAGGGDTPTRPDGGAYQSNQTLGDVLAQGSRDVVNRLTGEEGNQDDWYQRRGQSDGAKQAPGEAERKALEEFMKMLFGSLTGGQGLPWDPGKGGGTVGGDLLAEWAKMMGEDLSKTTDGMTKNDMARIRKYFEEMWLTDQASSRKFADGLLDPNATAAWEEASRQELMRGINSQKDEALRDLEARAGRGGAIGSGAQTGIYNSAMDATRAGELGLTQGSFDRQLQRGQVGAGILDNANRQKWDMLSEGFTSNKELFNLLATMLPGLVDGIVPL